MKGFSYSALALLALLGTASAAVVCPPQQGEMAPNNIANPADCGSFYSCNNGVPILMHCYPGLHWNDRYKICDHPEDAQCSATQKKEVKIDSPKVKSSSIAARSVVCPPQQGEMAPNNIANPEDCGSFYACNNGTPILMYCYPGLHWNDRYKICDHPEDAQCTATQKKEEKINSSKAKSSSIAARSVVCPPQQGEMAPNNIANPEDCGSFYACNNGIPILMYCYPGLHWNDRYKICDHPEDAQCSATQKKEVKIDSPKVKSSSTAARSVVCPPQQGEMAPNNIANPEDCGSFYACNNGTPILMYCYPGLHWNDRYKICDHPEDAQCTVAQK